MPIVSEGVVAVLMALLALFGGVSGSIMLNHQTDMEIVYVEDNVVKGLIHTVDDTIIFIAKEQKDGNIHFRFINKNGDVEIEYERNNSGSIPEEDKQYIEKILDEMQKERELRKKEQQLKEKEQEIKQLQFEQNQQLEKYKFDKKGEYQKEKDGLNKKSFWDYLKNLKGGIF